MEIVVFHSDIARLILGYLKNQKLSRASHVLCKTSPYLRQEFTAFKQGYQTHSFYPDLEEIIGEYVKISRKVDELMPRFSSDASWLSQLRQKKLSDKVLDIFERLLDHVNELEGKSHLQTTVTPNESAVRVQSDKENERTTTTACSTLKRKRPGSPKTTNASSHKKRRRALEQFYVVHSNSSMNSTRNLTLDEVDAGDDDSDEETDSSSAALEEEGKTNQSTRSNGDQKGRTTSASVQCNIEGDKASTSEPSTTYTIYNPRELMNLLQNTGGNGNVGTTTNASPRTPLTRNLNNGASGESDIGANDPPLDSLIDPNFSISKLIVLNDSINKENQSNDADQVQDQEQALCTQEDDAIYFDAATGQLTFPLTSFPYLSTNNETLAQHLQMENFFNLDAPRFEIALPEPITLTADQLPPNAIISFSAQKVTDENEQEEAGKPQQAPINEDEQAKESQKSSNELLQRTINKNISLSSQMAPGSLDSSRFLVEKATPSGSGVYNCKIFKSLSTPRKRPSHVRTLSFSPNPASDQAVIKNVEILPKLEEKVIQAQEGSDSETERTMKATPAMEVEVVTSTKMTTRLASLRNSMRVENETPKRRKPRTTAVKACRRQLSKSSNEEEMEKGSAMGDEREDEKKQRKEGETPNGEIKENEVSDNVKTTSDTCENNKTNDEIKDQPELLEEWRRMRSVNSKDIDVHLREINAKITETNKIKKSTPKKRGRPRKAAVKKLTADRESVCMSPCGSEMCEVSQDAPSTKGDSMEQLHEREKSQEKVNSVKTRNVKDKSTEFNVKLPTPQKATSAESQKGKQHKERRGKVKEPKDKESGKITEEDRKVTDKATKCGQHEMQDESCNIEIKENEQILAKGTEISDIEIREDTSVMFQPIQELPDPQLHSTPQLTPIAQAPPLPKEPPKVPPPPPPPDTRPPSIEPQQPSTSHAAASQLQELRTANIACLLDTPLKDTAVPGYVPPTPGSFFPSFDTPKPTRSSNTNDGEMLTLSYVFGSLTKSELGTPLLNAITPGFRLTPFSAVQLEGTPKDQVTPAYSSCSSYYKPDENVELDRNIDRILKDSAQKKRESEKAGGETPKDTSEVGSVAATIDTPLANTEVVANEVELEEGEIEETEEDQLCVVEVDVPAEKLSVEPLVLRRVKSFGAEEPGQSEKSESTAVEPTEAEAIEGNVEVEVHYKLVSGIPDNTPLEETSNLSSSSSSESSSDSSTSDTSSSSSSSSSSISEASQTVIATKHNSSLFDELKRSLHLDDCSEISSTDDDEEFNPSASNEDSQLVSNDGEVRYPVRSWLTPKKREEEISPQAMTMTIALPLKSADKRQQHIKELENKRQRIRQKLREEAERQEAASTPRAKLSRVRKKVAASMTTIPQTPKTESKNKAEEETRKLDMLTALNLSAKKQAPSEEESVSEPKRIIPPPTDIDDNAVSHNILGTGVFKAEELKCASRGDSGEFKSTQQSEIPAKGAESNADDEGNPKVSPKPSMPAEVQTQRTCLLVAPLPIGKAAAKAMKAAAAKSPNKMVGSKSSKAAVAVAERRPLQKVVGATVPTSKLQQAKEDEKTEFKKIFGTTTIPLHATNTLKKDGSEAQKIKNEKVVVVTASSTAMNCKEGGRESKKSAEENSIAPISSKGKSKSSKVLEKKQTKEKDKKAKSKAKSEKKRKESREKRDSQEPEEKDECPPLDRPAAPVPKLNLKPKQGPVNVSSRKANADLPQEKECEHAQSKKNKLKPEEKSEREERKSSEKPVKDPREEMEERAKDKNTMETTNNKDTIQAKEKEDIKKVEEEEKKQGRHESTPLEIEAAASTLERQTSNVVTEDKEPQLEEGEVGDDDEYEDPRLDLELALSDSDRHFFDAVVYEGPTINTRVSQVVEAQCEYSATLEGGEVHTIKCTNLVDLYEQAPTEKPKSKATVPKKRRVQIVYGLGASGSRTQATDTTSRPKMTSTPKQPLQQRPRTGNNSNGAKPENAVKPSTSGVGDKGKKSRRASVKSSRMDDIPSSVVEKIEIKDIETILAHLHGEGNT